MHLNKKVKMGEFYIVRLKDEFYHYGIKGMKLSDIYNKDQIIFLKTLNLDFEDKVSSLLLYHKIVSITQVDSMEAILTLDNGIELITIGNEGCGGCGNGWYNIYELNECDNVITDVQCLTENQSADGKYHLFVYAEDRRINCITYDGYDNGYYGTGYRLYVRIREKERSER